MIRGGDLVVLSHLRWTFVWQRPQHLISRLGRGRRTWFVEEPWGGDVDEPTLHIERHGHIHRVWLEIPGEDDGFPFDDPRAVDYGAVLAELLGGRQVDVTWLYTPMALPIARQIPSELLVYDVMDDLASFAKAPPALRALQQESLAAADLVFTGGRSLHAGVRDAAPERTFLFPSGVEPEHYESARAHRVPRERPVAGYVGVVDERLDLDLIAGLAARLPHFDIEIVGPVAKIDGGSLPQAPNLRYPGMQPYERLPEVMGGFDVALMPFAINEATQSISPTKTLEYLAAGLPVVSTPVPDVLADYADVVAIACETEEFTAACDEVVRDRVADRDAKLRPLLHRHHWDTIAGRMSALMAEALVGTDPAVRTPAA